MPLSAFSLFKKKILSVVIVFFYYIVVSIVLWWKVGHVFDSVIHLAVGCNWCNTFCNYLNIQNNTILQYIKSWSGLKTFVKYFFFLDWRQICFSWQFYFQIKSQFTKYLSVYIQKWIFKINKYLKLSLLKTIFLPLNGLKIFQFVIKEIVYWFSII